MLLTVYSTLSIFVTCLWMRTLIMMFQKLHIKFYKKLLNYIRLYLSNRQREMYLKILTFSRYTKSHLKYKTSTAMYLLMSLIDNLCFGNKLLLCIMTKTLINSYNICLH